MWRGAARRVTRRSLLGGAIATGATTGTAHALGLKNLLAPVLQPLLEPTYDVIVVGAGAAGMSAALGARRAAPKARIALLEAKPIHGGTSFRSGGRLWIPNNSDMRRAGLADPRDDALRYMARLSYPDRYDPGHPLLGLEPRHHAQLAAYYDNGAEIFDFYRADGTLGWEAERWQKFPWNADPLGLEGQFAPDYHPEFAENAAPRGRTVLTKHIDPTGLTGGAALPIPNYGASLAGIDLAQWLFLACLRRGIEFVPATRVDDVIARRSGGRTIVEGVRCEVMLDDAGTGLMRTLRARNGVVFTSGGFSKNRARLDATFTGDRRFTGGGCAVTSAKGDVVRIAERHGFALEHLDKAWWIQNIYEQYKLDPDSRTQLNYLLFQAYWLNGDSMVVVNRRGRRVVNEKLNYSDRTQAHFHPDNRFLFSVFDQHTFEHYFVGIGGQVTPLLHTFIGPARTTAELEQKLLARMRGDAALRSFGLAPDFRAGLDETLQRFGGFARAGVDEDFHRGETSIDVWWHCFSLYFLNVALGGVTLVRDPVRANVDGSGRRYPNPTMRPLKPPYYAVILAQGLQDTKGGPAIDEGGRILHQDGHPVTGLYGAGNAVASPAGEGYWGAGGTLGPAVVFGHIAGRNAARKA